MRIVALSPVSKGIGLAADPPASVPGDGLDRYLAEIGTIPLLSREQERDLLARMQAGDPAAKEQFIAAHLRLVVFVAKRYQGRALPLEDLIAECPSRQQRHEVHF